MEHGEVVGGALLVACGYAAELFQPIEEAFHPVASPIRLPVKARPTALLGGGRNHRPDVAPAQLRTRGSARKGLVSGHTPGPQTRAAALAADRTRVEQRWKCRTVVPLAASQLKADGLAVSLGPDVDLGREPAAALAQRLACDPPFSPRRRAPAVC